MSLHWLPSSGLVFSPHESATRAEAPSSPAARHLDKTTLVFTIFPPVGLVGLETMRTYPTPTRAETSDVANAILDGTDAVMLSGETASGEYPVQSVQMMNKIIVETETHMQTYREHFSHEIPSHDTFPDAISKAACEAAHNLKARAIIAFTKSGFTATLVSKYRPFVPIIAFTSSESVRRRLLLSWGVQTVKIGALHSLDEMMKKVEYILVSNNLADSGDTIVIVSGAPLGRQKTTNMVTLHRIGEKT